MKKLLLILLCVPMIGFSQTAKEYFLEAIKNYDNKEYTLAIDNYTKCIELKPENDNLSAAYYNRGLSYAKLGNYNDAISDFSRVIRIDPDYASAYKNRGITKETAGLPYCSDYKKGCDLGDEDCCKWYNNQCK